ncbi:FAR1-related sequence 5-like protein [Tanacetum coccineum]
MVSINVINQVKEQYLSFSLLSYGACTRYSDANLSILLLYILTEQAHAKSGALLPITTLNWVVQLVLSLRALVEKVFDLGLIPLNFGKNSSELETNKLIHSSSSITQNEELYLGSSTFESCDDLLKSVRAFYYTKGYGLSIRDSKKGEYIALQCEYRDVALLEKNEKEAQHLAKPRKDDRSLVGALLEELEKGGFSHDVDHDSEGRITRLFIIHPLSLKLARIFSNVFVMDFTYKTNKYKMPLFDIIGVSCFNTSFYSGFVFLKKEDKDSYVWDLKVFKKFLGHASQPAVIISDRELALLNG